MDLNEQDSLKQSGLAKPTTTLLGSSGDIGKVSPTSEMSGKSTGIPSHTQICLQGGSRARTSAPQGRKRELKDRGLGSGKNISEPLGRFDPDSHSLRTFQCSLVEDSMLSLLILPRSGMMQDGIVFQLPPLVPLTDVTGFSLWPTPTKGDAKGRTYQRNIRGDVNLCLPGAVRLFPTLTARDWKDNASPGALGRNSPSLGAIVHLFPTPTTPRPHDNEKTAGRYLPSQNQRDLASVIAKNGGQLNPRWVEWLMGFPLGWTDLDASGTP